MKPVRLVRWPLTLQAALTALLVAGSASAAEVKITDEARKHFNAGVALLRDPDGARYEDAYREFKVAYEASPSWKILGNLGLAAMKLERDGEAIAAFERYLSEGKKELDPTERSDIERDLSTLRAVDEPCYDQVWYGTVPSYSLTEITQPGGTNKTGDPLFLDPANGDFTPGLGSPAIDGGNPADAPTVDLDGNVRPAGEAPDMGAFEAP